FGSESPACGGDAAVVRNQYADHAILPRGKKQLAVAAAANVQIGPSHALAHRLLDQIAKRNVHAFAGFIAHIKLNLFDWCDGPGNSIVGPFHRRQVGGKNASILDVAEYKLALQRRYSPVISESITHRAPLVVIIDHDGVCKSILHSP